VKFQGEPKLDSRLEGSDGNGLYSGEEPQQEVLVAGARLRLAMIGQERAPTRAPTDTVLRAISVVVTLSVPKTRPAL
jgi:hypothetical protein